MIKLPSGWKEKSNWKILKKDEYDLKQEKSNQWSLAIKNDRKKE